MGCDTDTDTDTDSCSCKASDSFSKARQDTGQDSTGWLIGGTAISNLPDTATRTRALLWTRVGGPAAGAQSLNACPFKRPSSSSEPAAASPSKLTLSFGQGSNGHEQRDSITSVQDDPFFRNYQSPHSVSLAKELRSATYMNRYRDDGTPEEPPPRSPNRPLVDNAVKLKLPPQSRSGMSDINIAIIGSAGVGKSTLIQRALGLRALPTSIASSLRMSVDNVVYTVSLIELDLESFDIVPDRHIEWPKQINGHIVPRMDGALLLYDVMNRDSISELPQTLKGLANSSLPTILVSCKCDNPGNTRQLEVDHVEALCVSCVEAVKTAANVPESARLCLSSMLRAIMSKRNEAINSGLELPGSRRRATSSAHLETHQDPARPLSQQSKHSRASSEFSLLRGFPSQPPVSSRGQSQRPNGRTNLHQFSIPDPHEAPPLSSHPAFRNERSPLAAPGRAVDSAFLDMEESDADSAYRYSDDIPILQRNDDSFFDKPAKVSGVTFDELVDRLLGQNMCRADDNFSDIFLCLYRKFAAPSELFHAILNRLERIALDKNTHYLTRTATQLRIITVLARWVSGYPGDFASPSTSQKLNAFIGHLYSEPVFAAAAQDMRMQLQSRVVEDDDTGWARTDADVESETSSKEESEPASPLRRKLTESSDVEEDMQTLAIDEEGGEDMESQQSRADSETRSLSPSFHTVEDYEREAATMIPKATLPLTKFRYHIFMDTHDDYVADEMTRIDWVMFSSIRLRDLVRHVSLSLKQKEKCKSLANVNRMINHFNHIARWVANMILMRDKAKHRAQMLEKFMTIALKLRKLNNYNGLAAVLAGINGTAVHRLAQTRALVPEDVQKRFARLVLLMGSQKSHFAYRLAWENSPLPRIPFIPLHRRDLVSAEEGSQTFVGAGGDRINWKKFEVLSEVILPIMKSQVLPYPNLAKHDIARELILDCRMPVDDEDIYQRSLSLESPSASGTVELSKKKFPWFQKEK
ncbi:Ras guanine nucleotide exchange factor A [Lachnellula hyalina]|uniref:Ras guanine nucleotide exchange factor A n=1 Tax=Lachnellula hyalina TaxID=1316788 RepID=A0A8H8R9L3_9HELO|nr:Ras guanine nucleotide exchange factor A [Lachnellula hyalina]TVY31175.1 Ras guanine nucleotide exchange factor A [Lachnellula hyalina]